MRYVVQAHGMVYGVFDTEIMNFVGTEVRSFRVAQDICDWLNESELVIEL